MIIETKNGTWPCIYHGNGDSKNSKLFKKIIRLDTKEMYKEQNPKDADLTILTWSVKGETTMLEDCFERKGIKDSLYVMNIEKPFNWLDKIKTIQEYLPYVKTKYVMALDSTDIIISTDNDGKGRIWSSIVDVMETMGCKMLWNAEKRSWPSIGVGSDSNFNEDITKMEDFEDRIYKGICESDYCRLNSGAFIGHTDYVRDFYHTVWNEYTKEHYDNGVDENMFGGDQGFIRSAQRQAFPETVIDYDCRIFHTFVDVKEKEITIHE